MSEPKWSDLWGIAPDHPPTEADQHRADIAALQAELADLKAKYAAATNALAACREVAAKRAGRA